MSHRLVYSRLGGLSLKSEPRASSLRRAILGHLGRHGSEARWFSSVPAAPSESPVKGLRIDDLSASLPIPDPSVADAVISSAIAANPVTVDLGFGPTDVLLRVFLNVHELTGLPWWAAIVATTVFIRSAVVPLNIIARKNGARMTHFAPHFREFQEQYKADPPKSSADQLRRSQELQALQRKHGVKFSRSLLPVFVQLPLFVTFYFALNKLTQLDPTMKAEGALWFTDLTAPDVYAVLPIATAAIFLGTIEFAPEQEAPSMQKDQALTPAKMKNIMRMVGVMMVPISIGFPSSITLYWVTSNSYTFLQNMILQNHSVMRALDIPLPLKASDKKPLPDGNTLSMFARIDEMTKAVDNTQASVPTQTRLQEQFAAEMQEARSRRNKRRSGK